MHRYLQYNKIGSQYRAPPKNVSYHSYIFEYIYIRAKNRADSVKVEGRNQNQQMLIEKKIEHTCKSSRE